MDEFTLIKNIDTSLDAELEGDLDEGVVDVVKNIGRIAKGFVSGRGKEELGWFARSGKNAKEAGKAFETGMAQLVRTANAGAARKVAAIPAGPDKAAKAADAVIGTMNAEIAKLFNQGPKTFSVVMSHDHRALSVYENPGILKPKSTSPLAKISIAVDLSQPVPTGSEILSVTYDPALDKRLFDLVSAASQQTRATHSADTDPHSGHGDGGSGAPAADASAQAAAPAAGGSAPAAQAAAPAAGGGSTQAAAPAAAPAPAAGGSAPSASPATGTPATAAPAPTVPTTYNQAVAQVNANLLLMKKNKWKMQTATATKLKALIDELSGVTAAPAAAPAAPAPAPRTRTRTAP
jgi:hypothetical protein